MPVLDPPPGRRSAATQGFRWGVSTSAYQIEGAVAEDGRSPSSWDVFSHTPGRTANGDTGDIACDHWHRWPEDVDLMAELGIPWYRFSLAWPRIIPDGDGPVNEAALDVYRRLVDRLLERGIQPFAELYHWDLPQALQARGGWLARETIEHYLRYASAVWDALGDRVTTWTTHNEPWIIGVLGYLLGIHAPGVRDDWRAALTAMHHVLLSHGQATRLWRERAHPGEIGIVLNLFATEPAGDTDADREAARISDGFTNRWFLDALTYGRYPQDMLERYAPLAGGLDWIRDGDLAAIATPTDFLGVNYYARRLVRADPTGRLGIRVVDEAANATGLPLTGGGWAIHPQGLEDVLLRVHREYGAPVMFVTENGAIENDVIGPDGAVHDPERIAFLREHIAAVGRAIDRGADVRGYFVWSLMDNLEWADGYAKRFGLVYVDFPTQRRIPKDSARWYGEIARRPRP